MFTFQVVDTPELLEETFRFRYKIAHDELGYIEPTDNKTETDEYDEYSVHFAAFDSDKNLCAVSRAIFNSPIGYPTPTYMNTKLSLYEDSDKNFAEFSRVFINPDIRSTQNSALIIKNFFKLASYYVNIYEVDYVYSILASPFLRFLKMINIKFHIIGEASEYYGIRYPTILVWEELIQDNPELKFTK